MYKSKEQLRQEAMDIIKAHLQEAETRGCANYDDTAKVLLVQLESRIFAYAPLPVSIQEALNSGDGAYRP